MAKEEKDNIVLYYRKYDFNEIDNLKENEMVVLNYLLFIFKTQNEIHELPLKIIKEDVGINQTGYRYIKDLITTMVDKVNEYWEKEYNGQFFHEFNIKDNALTISITNTGNRIFEGIFDEVSKNRAKTMFYIEDFISVKGKYAKKLFLELVKNQGYNRVRLSDEQMCKLMDFTNDTPSNKKTQKINLCIDKVRGIFPNINCKKTLSRENKYYYDFKWDKSSKVISLDEERAKRKQDENIQVQTR